MKCITGFEHASIQEARQCEADNTVLIPLDGSQPTLVYSAADVQRMMRLQHAEFITEAEMQWMLHRLDLLADLDDDAEEAY